MSMFHYSIHKYLKLTDGVETVLDEAYLSAQKDSKRYYNDEVFGNLSRKIQHYKRTLVKLSCYL